MWDHLDSRRSDNALRDLIVTGRTIPAANTVALYALAPPLKARISRAATEEYQHDALSELALVL